MKNVLKRSISLFLAIAIIFGSACAGLGEIGFRKAFAIGADAGYMYMEYKINEDGESATLTYCDYYSEGEVVIPNAYAGVPVTCIGDEAFAHCYNITSIIIPDSVITIGVDAFRCCRALESVTIGKGVKSIGSDAFGYCSWLTSVYIDDITAWCNINFENSDSNPLYYADDLYINGNLATDVVIPDGVTQIPQYGFSYNSLVSIVIPESVTDIGDEAFSWCENLSSITIPDSVARIGDGAFRGCRGLAAVNIPDGVTSLGDEVFGYCNNLEEVTIGSGVTSISKSTFYECVKLSAVKFSENVTNIGERAFYYCKALNSIDITDGITHIGKEAFRGCESLVTITIPDSVISVGENAFTGCCGLISIDVEKANTEFSSVDGVLFNKDKTSLIQYPASKEGTQYIIPDGVQSISDNAFMQCVNLTLIIIPDSVTSIGKHAFSECIKLSSVTLPKNMTFIADYTFEGCENLASIVIPDSITSIGWQAFYDCEKLSSVVIGNGVTDICYEAFWGCTSLKSVAIPANVTNIEFMAFGYYFIGDGIVGTLDNFTIYGTVGTQAHKYAKNNKFKFVDPNHTHTSSSWIIDKKATVDITGSKHKECTECGEVLKTVTINQLKCSKPKLKTITNTTSSVKITWGKVSGADTYRVYRKTSKGDWTYIGSTTKTYYTDKTAKSGTKYYYAVRARNEAGNSSLSSSLSKYYLADPTLKTAKSTKNGIDLKWTKTAGAQGYVIYRKTEDGSYKKLKTEKGVSNLSYVDKSAKKGKKYTYKVKAYYNKTNSAYSNTKTVTDKY